MLHTPKHDKLCDSIPRSHGVKNNTHLLTIRHCVRHMTVSRTIFKRFLLFFFA